MKNIYFIKPVGADGPIKIGCSLEPKTRLAALSLQSPMLLETIAFASGGHEVEKALHLMFQVSRSHGEWFHATPELQSFIEIVAATGVVPLDIIYPPVVFLPVGYRRKNYLITRLRCAEYRVFGDATAYRPPHIEKILKSFKVRGSPAPDDDKFNAVLCHINELKSRPTLQWKATA